MDKYIEKILDLKEQQINFLKKENTSYFRMTIGLCIIVLIASLSYTIRVNELENRVDRLEETISEQDHYINNVERNLSSVEEELHAVEHVLDEVDYDEDLEIHNIWCYLIPDECEKPLQRHEM